MARAVETLCESRPLMALAAGLVIIALLGFLQPPLVLKDPIPGSAQKPKLCWAKLAGWGVITAVAVMVAPWVLKKGASLTQNKDATETDKSSTEP